jgi:hypothetical protein
MPRSYHIFAAVVLCYTLSDFNCNSFSRYMQRNYPLEYDIQGAQNSTAKLQEWIPHVERRKKGYDKMGPEMYGYRVVRACIY